MPNMRTLACSLSFIALAIPALTGCPGKKDANADGGNDAAVAVVDAGMVSKIANEADVKRYPTDETELDGDATVKAGSVDVRKAVPKGDVIASLKSGATVTQLVEHNGYALVTFDDPKDATRRLEGWVPKSVFQTPKVIAKVVAKVPKCADDELLSIGGDDASLKCRKACMEDTDCLKGSQCEDTSSADDKGNIIPFGHAQVCVVEPPPVVKDAGAPPAKDAGAPVRPASDAGGPMIPPGMRKPDAGH